MVKILRKAECIIRDLPDSKKDELDQLDIDWLFLADTLAKIIEYLEAK